MITCYDGGDVDGGNREGGEEKGRSSSSRDKASSKREGRRKGIVERGSSSVSSLRGVPRRQTWPGGGAREGGRGYNGRIV